MPQKPNFNVFKFYIIYKIHIAPKRVGEESEENTNALDFPIHKHMETAYTKRIIYR